MSTRQAMSSAHTFTTHSEEETRALGRQLAETLRPGATVLLYGDLGAGKTSFVRGLAEGLAIDPDEVSSPTFTIVQPYHGRLTLEHVDLYRLERAEVDDLGLEELADGNSVVAIEWAEKLLRTPTDAIEVRIADKGGETREINVSSSNYSTR
jgi:tRNA threonylcarbamoyladenosine biosynthesis protein TsaE